MAVLRLMPESNRSELSPHGDFPQAEIEQLLVMATTWEGLDHHERELWIYDDHKTAIILDPVTLHEDIRRVMFRKPLRRAGLFRKSWCYSVWPSGLRGDKWLFSTFDDMLTNLPKPEWLAAWRKDV